MSGRGPARRPMAPRAKRVVAQYEVWKVGGGPGYPFEPAAALTATLRLVGKLMKSGKYEDLLIVRVS